MNVQCGHQTCAPDQCTMPIAGPMYEPGDRVTILDVDGDRKTCKVLKRHSIGKYDIECWDGMVLNYIDLTSANFQARLLSEPTR